jgi:hypothetical protein
VRGRRECLLEQLQQLDVKLVSLVAEPGRIGAWLSQSLDDADTDRIGDAREHDRDRPRRLRGRERRLRARREHDVWLERDQFSRQRGQPVEVPLGEAALDHAVVSLAVAKLREPTEQLVLIRRQDRG